jgi:hypothetical protein
MSDDAQGDREESPDERLDRELIELLNELRVALPGVQMLFGFLLAVPFSQRFASVTGAQQWVYFVAFLAAAAASACLIAPSAFHRLRWREGDKERMLRTSNTLAIGGIGFLGISLSAALFVVTDELFARPWATLVGAAGTAVFALLWFAMPLRRRALRERAARSG